MPLPGLRRFTHLLCAVSALGLGSGALAQNAKPLAGTQINVVQTVLDLTSGYGCDVYIEATGHPAAVEQGLRMIRKLGTFVEFSVMREKVSVDWTIIGDTKELTINGSHLSPRCYPVAIRMIENGAVPIDEIVTHQMPLKDYLTGIELVRSGLTSVKVTLEP